MIPKRAFLYWESDKMSWMRYMTFYSFRKLHPDWQIDLFYSDMKQDILPDYTKTRKQDYCNYKGMDYFPKLADLNINMIKWDTDEVELQKFKDITPSGKSNVFKWHQLYKNGGIYLDTDILFFKPIDELFNQWNANSINVVICQTGYLSIGLLASSSNNDFYKDIFYNTFKFINHVEYQTYGTLNVFDLYSSYNNNIPISRSKVLEMAIKKYPHLNFYNLPMSVIYHFNHHDLGRCFGKDSPDISEFPDNAIGYHWYAGGSCAQAYNNLLNHENCMNYNFLYCKLYKKYFLNGE